MSKLVRRALAVVTVAAAVLALMAGALIGPAAGASTGADPFYSYTGSAPLASIAPGTVLKTRTVSYHLAGLTLPVTVVQLLYRSTGEIGQPTVNVTSVIKPPLLANATRAVSYQSFYDSLNPLDGPSYSLSGAAGAPGVADSESGLFLSFLLSGDTVIVSDTEGEAADFAAGPEYGLNTLDSIRAAVASKAAGLSPSVKVGLMGYSGGAIATGWAAALAPRYAPEVNRRLVGAAEGGVLVDPVHNLHYVDGSLIWAGVMPMAFVGIARAFHVDLTQYLNAYGQQIFTKMQHVGIASVLGEYPGLTFASMAKPQYSRPESIPVFVRIANALNMGTAPIPTVPMFIGQGDAGVLEGTSGSTPGIGPGDGVMIAGDVRSLARRYCAQGRSIDYQEYALSHVTSAATWTPEASAWLTARLSGGSATPDCAQIAPGNSLAPIP
jgi:hypothetical protein